MVTPDAPLFQATVIPQKTCLSSLLSNLWSTKQRPSSKTLHISSTNLTNLDTYPVTLSLSHFTFDHSILTFHTARVLMLVDIISIPATSLPPHLTHWDSLRPHQDDLYYEHFWIQQHLRHPNTQHSHRNTHEHVVLHSRHFHDLDGPRKRQATHLYYLPQQHSPHYQIHSYLFNTLTNLCIALYCILLYCVVLNCIVLLIYCYVDIIQYNAMHKFVGVLDKSQFTSSHSAISTSFLDVEVSLSQFGKVETNLYTKPTDKHQYVLQSSCHPLHTKRAISFSLALRLQRICSSDESFALRANDLIQYLNDRG